MLDKNLTFGGVFLNQYNCDFKLKVIKECIDGHHSSIEIAKKYKMSEIHLRRWIKLYTLHGIKGLNHKYQKYDSNFKENVLKYMEENHLSFLETAMRFNIPKDTTVARWYHKYKENGALELPNKKVMKEKNNNEKSIEDLIKENEYLRAENAYLKKLKALVQERNKRENKKKQ